jgi:predicted S18 family serine protease
MDVYPAGKLGYLAILSRAKAVEVTNREKKTMTRKNCDTFFTGNGKEKIMVRTTPQQESSGRDLARVATKSAGTANFSYYHI